MRVPSRIGMGRGVRMRKRSSGGVMRSRLAASEKKAKTSSRGSGVFCELLTAAPVSIDPYVLASGHETIFEGSQIEGAGRRRRWQTQGGGRKDLLCVDAHHKALAKETSRDGGRRAKSDPWQALQERGDAPELAAKAPSQANDDLTLEEHRE